MLLRDAPLYHDAMCSGTEDSFTFCQLPYPNPLTSCPSIGAVTCTEGSIYFLLVLHTTISSCRLAVSFICVFDSAAIAQCFSDGEFRLVNSNTTYRDDGSIEVFGRIEVCANFTYGSVCDYGWDLTDAQVFCRNYAQNILGGFTSNVSK